MEPSEDQRAHPRISLQSPVTCEVEGRLIPMRAVNISRGGLLVTGQELLAVGAEVNLRMTLGAAGEIELKALVRHNVSGCGIQFIGVLPEQQMRLYLYLDEVERQAAYKNFKP